MADSFPDRVELDKDVPFAPTKLLLVPVPLRETFIEGYIDDRMVSAVDINNNVKRIQHAVPLSVETIFRLKGGGY